MDGETFSLDYEMEGCIKYKLDCGNDLTILISGIQLAENQYSLSPRRAGGFTVRLGWAWEWQLQDIMVYNIASGKFRISLQINTRLNYGMK